MVKTNRLRLNYTVAIITFYWIFFEKASLNKAEKINPNGNFVNLENHCFHYYKKGCGGPTVVFEAAFDASGHIQWYHIQEKLLINYTSISNDRAGFLWSDRGNNPKSGEEIAKELHLLLEKLTLQNLAFL